MAKRVADKSTRRNPVVSNPRLLGQDVEELAWLGLGAGAAAVGNDRFIAPLLKTAAPSLNGGMGSKVIDVATTAGAAWGVGKLVSVISPSVGRDMFKGGMVLAVMKAIGIVVPGVTFTAGIPVPGGFPQIGGAPPMKALPAANGAVNGNATLARLGVGKMGL